MVIKTKRGEGEGEGREKEREKERERERERERELMIIFTLQSKADWLYCFQFENSFPDNKLKSNIILLSKDSEINYKN